MKPLSWWPRKFWTQIRLSYEMLTQPPDVLFIPAHLPPLCHPKKLVVTIHDLAFKQYPEVYSTKELRLQKWGIKQVLKKAWRIIVPSQFTKDEIVKYYPDLASDNIFVVPHGVDHDKFKTKNLKLKTKENTILYIGRLEHKKNLIPLVKAFNLINNLKLEIKNLKLILVGSPGFGYADIKREIDASPYKSNIHQLGWIDRDGLVDQLNQASLFVLPSLYEGFGLPLLEAMACGTAVACSDIPSLKEVGADVPLYFNANDPQDIAQKIILLLTDEALRRQKINQGLKRASEYTWQATAQKTWQVLTT